MDHCQSMLATLLRGQSCADNGSQAMRRGDGEGGSCTQHDYCWPGART